MKAKSIEDYRVFIDELDEQLISVLSKRIDICREIAHFKKENAIPMMQPARVEFVKNRVAALGAKKGVPRELVLEVYDSIIKESCRLEDEIINR